MPSPLHLIGHHVAGRFFNVRLGWQLMRDPKVASTPKVLALLVGVGATFALVAFEVPLEAVVGLVAPFLGLAADAMIDGAEMLLVPLLVALAVLPHLVRRAEAGAAVRRV